MYAICSEYARRPAGFESKSVAAFIPYLARDWLSRYHGSLLSADYIPMLESCPAPGD